MKRKLEEAVEGHEERFRTTFELIPEIRNDPIWKDAYEYAAQYKLYPDEINLIASMLQRKKV